jgi:branched-chain amino acid transport system permease protein
MNQDPITGHGGLKSAKGWIAAIVAMWALHFLVNDNLNPYYVTILMYAGINVVLAVSLNLVNGFTGQFSMGHGGFMAVGAYMSAMVVSVLIAKFPGIDESLIGSFICISLGMLLGGLAAAAAGYLVGMPSLRLRGDYLAIVTLGFGEIIRVILLNIDNITVMGVNIDMGGARGLPGIASLTNFGVIFTVVVLSVFAVWRIIHSAHGRVFLAIREDEIAADSMGVDTTKGKVRAFTFGAFLAGVGGALFAHTLCFLVPTTFDFNRSFEYIIMVVLGGMGSITGSVVAAIFLTVLKESLRPLQEITKIDFRMVIYALVLIILMLTRPNGLFGTKEIMLNFFKTKRQKA